jgi:hypothetical protein
MEISEISKRELKRLIKQTIVEEGVNQPSQSRFTLYTYDGKFKEYLNRDEIDTVMYSEKIMNMGDCIIVASDGRSIIYHLEEDNFVSTWVAAKKLNTLSELKKRVALNKEPDLDATVEEGRAPGRPRFTEDDVDYAVVFIGPRVECDNLNYPYDLKAVVERDAHGKVKFSEGIKTFYGKTPPEEYNYIHDNKKDAKEQLLRISSEYNHNARRSGQFKIIAIADLEDNDNFVFVRPGTLKKALAEA